MTRGSLDHLTLEPCFDLTRLTRSQAEGRLPGHFAPDPDLGGDELSLVDKTGLSSQERFQQPTGAGLQMSRGAPVGLQ